MSDDNLGLATLKVEGVLYFPDGRSFAPGDVGYDEAKANVEAKRVADAFEDMGDLKLLWQVIKGVWRLPPDKRRELNKAVWRHFRGKA